MAAATLVLAEPAVPSTYRDNDLVERGEAGIRFVSRIRDSVVLEFHDIRSRDDCPPLDVVVVHDTISFLAPDEQASVLAFLSDSVRAGGIVVVGDNEVLVADSGWQSVVRTVIWRA